MAEDGVDGLGCGDEGEDAHLGAAAGAEQWEDLVDAGEEARPAGAGSSPLRRVRRVGRGALDLRSAGDVGLAVAPRVGGGVDRHLAAVAVQGDDVFAQAPLGARTPW